MNTDQERAAFEWWASDEGENPRAVERVGECYKLAQTQSYWMAWQARAAIEADRQRWGEPVAWVKQDIAENQFINMRPRRIWWECNDGIGMPIYAAPQPAEPVKVPSDLLELLDKIESSAPMDVAGRGKYLHDIRALLARFGQPAQPAEIGGGCKYKIEEPKDNL